MTIAVTKVDQAGAAPSTPTIIQRFNVVMDNSYPTGGELLGLQALVGLGRTIASVQCTGIVTSTGAKDVRFYHYNRITDKLMAYTEALAETANAADLSLITVELEVVSY